jgi:hypothetical protein
MTSRALILVIALIIGSPADAQQCPSKFANNNPCPEQAFQSQICYMQDNFDPTTLDPTHGKGYNTPHCAGGTRPDTTLLTAAYNLAPPKVKAALCQLHKIFVTRDASYGPPRPPIGLWEGPRGNGHVWIAIPDYILDNASSLEHAENGILGGLFVHPTPAVPPPYPTWPPAGRSLPTFLPSGTSGAAEILAVLAHELGHIMLADTNADGVNQLGNPNHRPCNPPASSCFSTYFLAGWNAVAPLPIPPPAFKQRRWIAFNDPNPSIRYGSAPGFADIAADIALGTAAGDAQATTGTYQGIYSGPFVSVFAALSPEEDYVETYKYKTLGAAGGGSLNLSISLPNFVPASVDVLARVRAPSPALQNKLACVPAVD